MPSHSVKAAAAGTVLNNMCTKLLPDGLLLAWGTQVQSADDQIFVLGAHTGEKTKRYKSCSKLVSFSWTFTVEQVI